MGVFSKAVNLGADFLEEFPKTPIGETVSPLKLFQREQLGKLSRLMDTNGTGSTLGGMARQYFSGQTISRISDSAIEYAPMEAQAAMRIANRRKLIAGTAFGLAAANSLDINPGGITDKLTNASMLGVHYGIGRTLMGMGGKTKLAGMAYLGTAALNTFRPGDNLGPM